MKTKPQKKTAKGWHVEEVCAVLKKIYREDGWQDSWGVRVVYLNVLLARVKELLVIPNPKKK